MLKNNQINTCKRGKKTSGPKETKVETPKETKVASKTVKKEDEN